MQADDTFDSFWKQKEPENKAETNKEASTELLSVVKHLGSGYSTQEVGRNTRLRLVFFVSVIKPNSPPHKSTP